MTKGSHIFDQRTIYQLHILGITTIVARHGLPVAGAAPACYFYLANLRVPMWNSRLV